MNCREPTASRPSRARRVTLSGEVLPNLLHSHADTDLSASGGCDVAVLAHSDNVTVTHPTLLTSESRATDSRVSCKTKGADTLTAPVQSKDNVTLSTSQLHGAITMSSSVFRSKGDVTVSQSQANGAVTLAGSVDMPGSIAATVSKPLP